MFVSVLVRYSTDVDFLYYTDFRVRFVLQTLLQPTDQFSGILLQLVKSGQKHLKMPEFGKFYKKFGTLSVMGHGALKLQLLKPTFRPFRIKFSRKMLKNQKDLT